MKKLVFLLPLGLFIVMVVFFTVGLNRDPRLIPSPLIGKAAPAFELSRLILPVQAHNNTQTNTDIKQSKVTETIAQDDLKGTVSLVNFWATWCPSCRGEHDVLMKIARVSPVTIYGVDYKDNRDDAIQWLQKLGNPYRAVAFDSDGKVGIDWGVYGTPETFVLDADGIIRYKHVGAVTWEVWMETLAPVIKQLQQR